MLPLCLCGYFLYCFGLFGVIPMPYAGYICSLPGICFTPFLMIGIPCAGYKHPLTGIYLCLFGAPPVLWRYIHIICPVFVYGLFGRYSYCFPYASTILEPSFCGVMVILIASSGSASSIISGHSMKQ